MRSADCRSISVCIGKEYKGLESHITTCGSMSAAVSAKSGLQQSFDESSRPLYWKLCENRCIRLSGRGSGKAFEARKRIHGFMNFSGNQESEVIQDVAEADI